MAAAQNRRRPCAPRGAAEAAQDVGLGLPEAGGVAGTPWEAAVTPQTTTKANLGGMDAATRPTWKLFVRKSSGELQCGGVDLGLGSSLLSIQITSNENFSRPAALGG